MSTLAKGCCETPKFFTLMRQTSSLLSDTLRTEIWLSVGHAAKGNNFVRQAFI